MSGCRFTTLKSRCIIPMSRLFSVGCVDILQSSLISKYCDICVSPCGLRIGSLGTFYGSPPPGTRIARLWLDFLGAGASSGLPTPPWQLLIEGIGVEL